MAVPGPFSAMDLVSICERVHGLIVLMRDKKGRLQHFEQFLLGWEATLEGLKAVGMDADNVAVDVKERLVTSLEECQTYIREDRWYNPLQARKEKTAAAEAQTRINADLERLKITLLIKGGQRDGAFQADTTKTLNGLIRAADAHQTDLKKRIAIMQIEGEDTSKLVSDLRAAEEQATADRALLKDSNATILAEQRRGFQDLTEQNNVMREESQKQFQNLSDLGKRTLDKVQVVLAQQGELHAKVVACVTDEVRGGTTQVLGAVQQAEQKQDVIGGDVKEVLGMLSIILREWTRQGQEVTMSTLQAMLRPGVRPASE